jgi:hypothetical protein
MRHSIPPTAAALLVLAAALCVTLTPSLTAASELNDEDTINVLDKRLPYAGEACCATVGCEDTLCHPTQYQPSSLDLNGSL